MIWQFPLWWFGLPGILKGWADRVFAMGRTYGGERFYENGVFKGKRALLSLTTGGPEAVYQKGGWNGDIHAMLRPIQRGILRFTGWEVLAPNIVYAEITHQALATMHLLEQRGSSFARMRDTMLDHGLDAAPLHAQQDGYFVVTFNGPKGDRERLKLPEGATGIINPAVEAQLSDRQRKMVSMMLQ
jgi:hypothetical protein